LKPSDLFTQFLEIAIEEAYYFQTANRSPLIIDAGANVGAALAYFKWLYPESRILAFEPNPKLYEVCAKNIERNKWTGVSLLPFAISDREGKATFNCCEDMPMASSMSGRPLKFSCESVEVDVAPLSSFLQEKVDFLKLDIEGAEAAAVCEAENRFDMVERGFIEYHYSASSGVTANPLSSILGVLERQGFAYRICPQPLPGASAGHHDRSLALDSWSCSIFFERKS
jgi:FkbM family methyltransferase